MCIRDSPIPLPLDRPPPIIKFWIRHWNVIILYWHYTGEMPGVCLYGAQNMRPLGDKTTGRSTPFPTCLTITGFTQSHSHRSMKGLYRPWTFPFSNAPQHTTWKSDVLHFNFWNRGRCEHRERNSYFIFWAGHIKNSMHNVCTCTQIWTILYVLTKQ